MAIISAYVIIGSARFYSVPGGLCSGVLEPIKNDACAKVSNEMHFEKCSIYLLSVV